MRYRLIICVSSSPHGGVDLVGRNARGLFVLNRFSNAARSLRVRAARSARPADRQMQSGRGPVRGPVSGVKGQPPRQLQSPGRRHKGGRDRCSGTSTLTNLLALISPRCARICGMYDLCKSTMIAYNLMHVSALRPKFKECWR